MRKSAKRELIFEEVFLVHTFLFPIMGTVERFEHLGLNEYQGQRLRRVLVKKGLNSCLFAKNREGDQAGKSDPDQDSDPIGDIKPRQR